MSPARFAVLLAAASAVLAVVPVAHAEAPRIERAGPTPAGSDRPAGPSPAVTFSPDGDGHRDAVWVIAAVRRGASARLWITSVPRVGPGRFTRPVVARTGRVRLRWDGSGFVAGDRSYRVHVCADGRCSEEFAVAHARRLTVDVDPFRSLPAGGLIDARIASDSPLAIRASLVRPYALDAAGIDLGARAIGRSGIRLPGVVGAGSWLLRVEQGSATAYAPLAVRGGRPSAPPARAALVVIPALTWRAYDAADCDRNGAPDSWYGHPLQPSVPRRCAYAIGSQAPGLPPAFPRFAPFQRWFDAAGRRAVFVTDLELAGLSDAALRRYATIVFPGHTEYYPPRLYDALLRYRSQGGRLLFLSANAFYGTVALRDDRIERLAYRLRTARRSDFALAGAGFSVCCWPSEWRRAYRVTQAGLDRVPWLFDGTGVVAGSRFGIAVQEVDRLDERLSPRTSIAVATATIPPSSTVLPVSPKDAQAWVGTRPFPYRPARLDRQRADVVYATVGAGEVLTWGNVGFLASLYDASLPAAERAALRRALDNAWERFTR